MNKSKFKASHALLLLLLLVLGAWLYNSYKQTSELIDPKDRAQAPYWELKDLEGKLLKSSDFHGRVVILDFWATWCPPCRAEIPGFLELHQQYSKDGLVMIGISVDDPENQAKLQEFVKNTKISYPVLLADERVQKAFGGIHSIPTTFLVDREGRIASKHIGFTQKSVFDLQVRTLLNL